MKPELCLPTICIALLVMGCQATQKTAKVSAQAMQSMHLLKAQQETVDPVELQHNLSRVADEFAIGIAAGVDQLRKGTNSPEADLDLQKWRLTTSSDAWAIASGPNAVGNLLDFLVLASLSRAASEDYWMRELYGEAAQPLVESCRTAEKKAWHLADSVLSPEQKNELTQAIAAWRAQHARVDRAFFVRALGWTSEIEKTAPGKPAQNPKSVFNLLMIDPLAGLDPAAREIAETRIFAERAMYVAQRMPNLLRWQTELLSANTVRMPEVQQVIANSTQLAEAANRLSITVEKLPAQMTAERREIVDSLDQQSGKLRDLSAELTGTLKAGEKMSSSINTTLVTFDSVMKRFGVGENPSTPVRDTNRPPFNILDYARTAERLAAASKELDIVLKDFAGAMDSPAWAHRVEDASKLSGNAANHARSVLNHAFVLCVILIFVASGCFVFARMLIARFASPNAAVAEKPRSSFSA